MTACVRLAISLGSLLLIVVAVSGVNSSDEGLRRLFEWGATFGGTPSSYNVKYDCSHNGQPMCCGLMEDNVLLPEVIHGVGIAKSSCFIKKNYVQSPYELGQFEVARKLAEISDFATRQASYINHIRLHVESSNKWLQRVRAHMQSEVVPLDDPEDLKYLSRFEVTKTCTGPDAHLSSNWTEWIEPLTIHARHPFSMRECNGVYTAEDVAKMDSTLFDSLQGADYVLIQSGAAIHEATALTRHTHANFAPHRNHHAVHREAHLVTHNYFLDAGTSTFESSLRWFLCAYLQRKIVFDQDYGFEYTLLEPQDFWKRVPPSIRPVYHFFNAPVSNGTAENIVSPIQFIRQIAKPEDFVSFKLDIDTPQIEIPLALELAKSAEMMSLVDEFFFELHFRCEVLMFCGWGPNMPEAVDGLKLDRLTAMTFFRDLRVGGVRSHFWP